MTENKLKPALGEQVLYFDPSLPKKVGFGRGHDGRGAGPYLAFVTNDIGSGVALLLALPMATPFAVRAVHKDDAKGDTAYWDWKDPLQEARATKRFAASEAKRKSDNDDKRTQLEADIEDLKPQAEATNAPQSIIGAYQAKVQALRNLPAS